MLRKTIVPRCEIYSPRITVPASGTRRHPSIATVPFFLHLFFFCNSGCFASDVFLFVPFFLIFVLCCFILAIYVQTFSFLFYFLFFLLFQLCVNVGNRPITGIFVVLCCRFPTSPIFFLTKRTFTQVVSRLQFLQITVKQLDCRSSDDEIKPSLRKTLISSRDGLFPEYPRLSVHGKHVLGYFFSFYFLYVCRVFGNEKKKFLRPVIDRCSSVREDIDVYSKP